MMAMKKSSSGGFGGVVWLIMGIQLVAVAGAAQVSGKEVDEQLDYWKIKTVFVLGDSTLDVGNNNYLKGKDIFRANKPYWGIDYWPSIFNPTGRFSNGYNVADYISKKLGLTKSPPAYLSMVGPLNFTLVSTALTTGVSFASGGAGILDSTNIGQCIPLSTQMKNMELTRAAMVSRVGEQWVSDLFARSFFLVGIGNNDMFGFGMAHGNATQAEVTAFYTSLIGNLSDTITSLYKMGARKVGVINAGLVGCVPLMRFMNNPTGSSCNSGMNLLTAGFNQALAALFSSLAEQLPGFTYSIADSYGFAEAAFANPAASGYASVDTACCGLGRLGAEDDCKEGGRLCKNRDQFAFFDRIHPSQRACSLAADAYYDGPAQYTSPINFKQLAWGASSSSSS